MSTTKITDLPVLTTPSANGANTVFVVVDKSSGTFTTKQLTLGNLDISLDNVAPVAWAHANAAFDKANSANVVAQAGWNQANTSTTLGQAAFDKANSANVIAQAGWDKGNSSTTLAQAAYDQANTANSAVYSVDYTTISTTAGVYGNATHVAVVTLAANGRVSSITNTAITGFANATFAQAAFDAANTQSIGTAAFAKANSANVLAQQAYDAANTNGATFNSYAANTANTAWLTANAAFVQANAANSLAANAVAKTGSTMTGDLNIQSSNLTITSAFGGVGGTANIQGKLTVGTPGFTELPNLIAQFTYSTSSYSQVNQENTNAAGSGDFVVTADNGDDGNNYIDMGMAGSSYSDAGFSAYLPNDGWLIVQGKEGQGYGGNLILGTSATNTDILVLQAGTSFDEEVARFVHGEGLVLKYNTTSTSNSTGTLVVQGGIGANGNVYSDAVYTGNVFVNGTNLITRIQSAYDYANTIATTINNTFITESRNTANAAYVTANGAYTTANSSLSTSALAYTVSNTAQGTANASFVQANAAFDKANSANVLAQQAYDSSNTVSNIATPAFAQANAAFDKANSANTLAQAAYDAANTNGSGYNQANTATTLAQGAFDFANTVNTYAYSAYATANTNASTISSVSTRTNSAFDVANTALQTAAIALNIDNQANGAFDRANTAYDQANTATTLAGNVFDRSNTAWTQANTATTTAQAAFNTANNANANTLSGTTLAGTVTGSNLSSVGTLTILTVSGNTTVGNLTISTGGTITGNAAEGNVTANAVGYIGMPQNNLTSNYTITLADQGKHLYYNVSSNNVLYIPTTSNVAFPVGATIAIISRTSSSANVTITPNTGVSLFLAGNTTSAGRNVTTYGMATLVCVAANTWFINGTGVSAL